MKYKLSRYVLPLLVLLPFSLLGNKGCVEFVPKPIPDVNAVPEVQGTLLELLNRQETSVVLGENFSSPSANALSQLGTPEGILLKLRYERLGIILVEALKTSRDQQLLERVFDIAEWSENVVARSEALVTLGSFSDPRDLRYFKIGLADNEVAIRFAAVEGLQKWSLPEGLDLLKKTARDPWSPLVQVLAAQAVLSLGDEEGLATLREAIRSESWIVRALAARYIGQYGTKEDGERIARALNRETSNDFVAAEMAIAAIKLGASGGPIRQEARASVPVPAEEPSNQVGYQHVGDVIEMEPLIIQPPRLRLSKTDRVAPAINNKLLLLIRDRLDNALSVEDQSDPNLEDLYKMATPLGFALQTRYDNLSTLVAEGLGGTQDGLLRQELVELAKNNRNPLGRATALVSLGYSANEEDLATIQEALSSTEPKVRFAAMEAVLVGRFKDMVPSILNIAFTDPLPAFRTYAMRVAAAFGDPAAYNLLLTNNRERDWIARGMTYWYLGRYGRRGDFLTILSELSSETNPFVQGELALGASRLAPVE